MKLKRLLLIAGFLLIAAGLGFVLWAGSPMAPEPAAFAALQSDPQVAVSLEKFIVFQPAKSDPSTAFVFYPGGRVDYRAYAAPLHKIAAEGYLVILLPVRLNLALFDVSAADAAIAAFPEIRHWVVGGHSLGGVAAAEYASSRQDLDGLVFWASFPANDSLKNTGMNVLSIYGTMDISSGETFEASRSKLPPDAQFVVIDGGNHAQFGDYGVQPGDHLATITRTDQQRQAVNATVNFLKEISQ